MTGMTLRKKKEYEEAVKLLPSLAAIYIVKRIILLESIFNIPGVEKIINNGDYESTNMGDSYHYMPSITVSNQVSVEGINIDNDGLTKLLRELNDFDNEISEYVAETVYSSEPDRDSINSQVSDVMDEFILQADILKENRFEIYKEAGSFHFSAEAISYFNEFIDSLKNNKPYKPPVKIAYGKKFEVIPISENAFQDGLDLTKSQQQYKLDFIFSNFTKYLNEVSKKKSHQIKNGFIIITINKDADISFQYFNNEHESSIWISNNDPYTSDKKNNYNKNFRLRLKTLLIDENSLNDKSFSLSYVIQNMIDVIGSSYITNKMDFIKDNSITFMTLFEKMIINNSVNKKIVNHENKPTIENKKRL